MNYLPRIYTPARRRQGGTRIFFIELSCGKFDKSREGLNDFEKCFSNPGVHK